MTKEMYIPCDHHEWVGGPVKHHVLCKVCRVTTKIGVWDVPRCHLSWQGEKSGFQPCSLETLVETTKCSEEQGKEYLEKLKVRLNFKKKESL